MKNKGFTLIELLAVIVVLAVIALIAIPTITSVIDKAKQGALKDSAYGILDAGEMYLAKNMSEGITDTMEFTCSNGVCINGEEKITYKGQIETGRIRIYSDSKIELCITDNKYSALKKVTDKELKVEKGTCKYEELNYDVAALVSKDDYDKVVNELNDFKKIGTATSDDILDTKKALVGGKEIIGTMENRGELNWNPSESTSYTLLPGYYSGGTISTSNAYISGTTNVTTASKGTASFHLSERAATSKTITFNFPRGVLGVKSVSSNGSRFIAQVSGVSGNSVTLYVVNESTSSQDGSVSVTVVGN